MFALPRELDLPPRSGIKVEFRGLLLDRSSGRQARVLYDYNAMNEDELTVVSGMVSACGAIDSAAAHRSAPSCCSFIYRRICHFSCMVVCTCGGSKAETLLFIAVK